MTKTAIPYLEERNPDIGPDLVLDTVKATRDRIAGTKLWTGEEEVDATTWCFGDWSSCTCGHVYWQATGRKFVASDDEEGEEVNITSPRKVDGLYEEVLKVIALANEDDLEPGYVHALVEGADYLANVVSNLTSRTSASYFDADEPNTAYELVRRDAAVQLLDNTIAWLEVRYEQARHELAGTTATPRDPLTGGPDEG